MLNFREYGTYLIKGILIGAADLIPGVSGGTIAFITGIYEKLIEELNNIDLLAFKYLFTGKWKSLNKKIHLAFLLTLMSGAFIAIFSLARLVQYLLDTYPVAVWAFFFGLIVGSTIVIARHINLSRTPSARGRGKWNLPIILALICGTSIAWWLTSTSVIHTPDTGLYIYLSGVVAIMAMILPGISGSFILLILDKYTYIIAILSTISMGIKEMVSGFITIDMDMVAHGWQQMELMPLFIFQLGTLTGLLGFSKVLHWLFKRYHDITIALLTGFLIGSLNKCWPWKNTLETYLSSHGVERPLIQENILPTVFDTYFFISIALAIFGFILVYAINQLSVISYQLKEQQPNTDN